MNKKKIQFLEIKDNNQTKWSVYQIKLKKKQGIKEQFSMAGFDNLYANLFNDVFTIENQVLNFGDHHIAIFKKLLLNNDYFLGTYSSIPAQDNLQTENIEYSSLEKVEKQQATGYPILFFVSFEKEIIISMDRSETHGFQKNLSTLFSKFFLIGNKYVKDWKMRIREFFHSFEEISITERDEKATKDRLAPLTEIISGSENIVYKCTTFKVKSNLKDEILTDNFINEIMKTDFDKFESFKITGKTHQGSKTTKDILNDLIREKLLLEQNELFFDMTNTLKNAKKIACRLQHAISEHF